MREAFPIDEIIPELKAQLNLHSTIILQAPPGAGKSTILPIELLNEPWMGNRKILMLEPRRLAARAVANRMAFLLEEEIAETVGYRVRFENRCGKNTRIEVLTEGILTRMIQGDNTLEGVSLVIFDEFHERSLHADLALALCRQVQQVLREDLKILVMSATMDAASLSALLGNAPILKSEGRQYPVELRYVPQEASRQISRQMAGVIRRVFYADAGDILAFLPGAGEITRTLEQLEDSGLDAKLHPLYGDLPRQQQDEAIQPDKYGRRKIVLATSIAETSLTIEGIRIVVDSGYARVPRFDPRSGLTRLETVTVTRDAADQRAGRAGRLGPGICYRLWSESANLHLQAHRKPEILEADLAPLMLELANWGVKDVNEIQWPTPPPPGAVSQALDLLNGLEALEGRNITARGKEILRLPTHPRIAHLLLEGRRMGHAALAADVAALLEERDPLPGEQGTDLSFRVEILRKWRSRERVNAERSALERIEKLAASWRRLLNVVEDNAMPDPAHVGLLIAAAYPERIAKQREKDSGRYRLANGRAVKMDKHDPLVREEWIAVALLDAGQHEGQIFSAAPLDPEALGHLMKQKQQLSWDRGTGTLIARMETCIGDLVLKSLPLKEVDESLRIKILCAAVREDPSLLNWTDAVEQLRFRVLSLREWRTNEAWPDFSKAALLSRIEDWLPAFLQHVKSRDGFMRLDLFQILMSQLPWELANRMNDLAPTHVNVPSGSRISLQYHEDGSAPVLAVRLQEMFGLLDTPAVNEGRNKVMLHLLSPAYRPVQVTQDLRSFWQNTYPEVRKELRMRYPKHFWPDDPWTAEAVRGVKKKK